MPKRAPEKQVLSQVLDKTPKKKSRLTKKQKIIAGVLLSLIVLGSASYFLFFKKESNPQQEEPKVSKQEEPKAKVYSPLSGVEVTEDQAKLPISATIIENSPAARPQSGLIDAGVVYEAIAEGGITRFAAFYQEGQPQELGPVRSLRPYFLDWMRPFDPTVIHVGGSKKALNMVRDGTWRDMDQFANGKSFRRVTDRRAPHNVYTSFENINAFNASKDYGFKEFPTFARKDDQPSATPNATNIKLNISSATYNSEVNYQADTNSYQRSQGGAVHVEKSGQSLNPKVVVALIIPYSIVNESDGSRYSYQTIGSGEAVVFQDGTATPATWSKPTQSAQLNLKDSNGQDLKLNRGQTWFTVLNQRSRLVF